MARGDDVRRERVWCPKRDGGCGKQFWRDIGSRRRKCPECSPPRVSSRSGEPDAAAAVLRLQNPSGGPDTPGTGGEAAGEAVERVVGDVEAATLARLTARGRADTPEGKLALLLARQMETRVHSGSQLAAMSKELRDALATAVAGAPRENDAVDELFERRARRAGRGA